MEYSRDLTLLNWRFRSELDIVALPEWQGSDDHPVDIDLRLGRVPAVAGDGPVDVIVLDDGSAVVVAEDIGRFHVIGGGVVIAEVEPTAIPGAVETMVLGPVFAAICCQRNIQTLHCNTVVINGQAIALSGNSGAGKSTLAAVLASRGHALISDDVLAVVPSGEGTLAYTGNRYLRLWRETLCLLGHDASGLRRAATGDRDKYFLPPTEAQVASLWPLKALIWLDRMPTEVELIEPMVGLWRAKTVSKAVYRLHLAKDYYRRGSHALADLSLRGAAVYRVSRPRDLSRLDRQADTIELLAAT
jgi:hypothetical protein